MCGSCWAFAAAHVFTDYLRLRGQSRIETFSPDYLTKCKNPNINLDQGIDNGCCGGNALIAFRHFFLVGAVPETCLQYTLSNYLQNDKEENPLRCPRSCANPANSFNPASNRISSFMGLSNEGEVINALDQGRPVFAAVRAGPGSNFCNYRCGVLLENTGLQFNHAVEIVDYSRADPSYQGSPYWVIKNSWGMDWGEGGYVRIARGQNQLTGFVTISASMQTTPPTATPALTVSACSRQAPTNRNDNELIESAAEFAINQLNNRNEIRCADNTAVATLSLSSVISGTIQVVEGFMVEVTVEVNVGGCTENRATVTFEVMIDLNDNFSLINHNGYTVSRNSGASASSSLSAFAILFMIIVSMVAIIY